jgi:PAS domain S-box-containing protein
VQKPILGLQYHHRKVGEMNDQNKSKEQLISELAEMRQRVAKFEEARNGFGETNSHLAPGDPQWHSLVANTPVFILILDRDHCIRFVNHTQSGDSPDGLIGKKLYDFSPPDHHDTVRECLDRVLETGEPDVCEGPALCLDGQEHWYESHIGPIVEDGKVVALSVASVNATARKQVEQQRDRTHAILNAAIECLPFDFFALDSDGRYMLVNAVARMPYGDIVGKTPEEVCPNEHDLAVWLENNREQPASIRR